MIYIDHKFEEDWILKYIVQVILMYLYMGDTFLPRVNSIDVFGDHMYHCVNFILKNKFKSFD